MKSYRKIKSILCCFIIIFLFSSCSGYNKIMFKHLSNLHNYTYYEVKIDDIYFTSRETGKREKYIKDLNEKTVLEGTVYLTGVEIDQVYGRCDMQVNGSKVEPPLVFLEIEESNSQILFERNFYIDFATNNTVKIWCSDFVYMDTDFFFVIGVEYNGKIYLEKEEGLNNVIKMMTANKSLL